MNAYYLCSMHKPIRLFLLISMLSCLVVFSRAQTTLDTAVDFNVKDIHGNKYILFDLLNANKIVVLDFFSTACGPCVTYAPDMQQAYNQYGANQGDVVFLGMAWSPYNADVAAFDSANGITYPTISGQGYSYQVITDYNSQSFPTTLVIMPDRHIFAKQIWPPSFQNIDSVLQLAQLTASVVAPPEPLEMKLLDLFPNPVNEVLHFSLSIASQTSLHLKVYSSQGALIQNTSHTHLNRGPHSMQIPVAHLDAGIYFVTAYATDGTGCSFKFVKE